MTKDTENAQNEALRASCGQTEAIGRLSQPNAKLVRDHLEIVRKWRDMETEAMAALESEPHVEDGVLVFDRYDELMANIREARVGQAAAEL